MRDKEFVQWLRGFVQGVHHYNITPAQWDYLKEKLNEVQEKNTIADYSIGNWYITTT
jgi:hypothetical protein